MTKLPLSLLTQSERGRAGLQIQVLRAGWLCGALTCIMSCDAAGGQSTARTMTVDTVQESPSASQFPPNETPSEQIDPVNPNPDDVEPLPAGIATLSDAAATEAPASSLVDAATPNMGTPDAATPNTGTPNTGTPNTGTPNTGTPDAATPNTGKLDAATNDGGHEVYTVTSHDGVACPADIPEVDSACGATSGRCDYALQVRCSDACTDVISLRARCSPLGQWYIQGLADAPDCPCGITSSPLCPEQLPAGPCSASGIVCDYRSIEALVTCAFGEWQDIGSHPI
jgi:hypothetical protein